jgi:hypothetical protein
MRMWIFHRRNRNCSQSQCCGGVTSCGWTHGTSFSSIAHKSGWRAQQQTAKMFWSFPHGHLQILLMAGFDAKPESEMPSVIGMECFSKATLLLFRNGHFCPSFWLRLFIHQPLRPKSMFFQLTLSMRRRRMDSFLVSRPVRPFRSETTTSDIGHGEAATMYGIVTTK